MAKLTPRQLKILGYIQQNPWTSTHAVKEYLAKEGASASRITVVRDIGHLVRAKLIQSKGKGRAVTYHDLAPTPLLRFIDVESYFKKNVDERPVRYSRFNGDVFRYLRQIFIPDEREDLSELNKLYRQHVKKLSATAIKKEFERLTIELSWKSSRIEGNTYSLIDTEILLKQHQETAGHTKDEALMIINHKKALDYVANKKSDFKKITLRKIENIQRLIVEGLGVNHGIRKRPVRIIGTRYVPMDNPHQIREGLEKTADIINQIADPFSKALVGILMISYLQPFEDGNKRTARLLGNAILLAHNACPLSYRSVNESDYKKAMILFYEQNTALFFKQLFIEQFRFAVNNYFLA